MLVFDFGCWVFSEGLEGPEFAAFFDVDRSCVLCGRFFLARVDGSLLDPLFEDADLLLRKLFVGWHLGVLNFMPDDFQKEAVLGVTREDGWTGITALLPAGFGVKQETALGFAGLDGVAFVAVV